MGGAGLQADAGVAALGLGLLQLQVRQRKDTHPGGQLHVRVLLPGPGDQHTHLLRRLVAPGCAQVSAVQGRVRRGVPESRRALSCERGGASIKYVSTGCVGLRCHFQLPFGGFGRSAAGGLFAHDTHGAVVARRRTQDVD